MFANLGRSAALALLCCHAAFAATHCVGTSDGLSAALLAAQQNTAGSDEVRIRTGTYTAPAGGWHVDVQQRGIVVEGGYLDAQCQTRTADASKTVLDGATLERPLTIDTSFSPAAITNIVVRGLTFANGPSTRPGGLKVSDSGPIYNGPILIENDIFRDNAAGGLVAATDGNVFDGSVDLTVRNCLFVGNRAADASAANLFSNNAIAVSNNTVTQNQSFDTGLATRTAFVTFTFAQVFYANNVFWANNPDALSGSFDLHADNPQRASLGAALDHNDLQAVLGAAGSQQGELSIDPQFIDAAGGDFHPGAHSPLIGSATATPAGGLAPTDLDGHARPLGAPVDIGAYAFDRIFAGSFE